MSPTTDNGSSTGGAGGAVTATIAVRPGIAFQVNVGSAGTLGSASNTGSGWNGGGAARAGGGGGATDIRTDFDPNNFNPTADCAYRLSCTLAQRVVVAGGGGGGSTRSGANGGIGGAAATAGTAVNVGGGTAGPGQPGTASAGGACGATTITATNVNAGFACTTPGSAGLGSQASWNIVPVDSGGGGGAGLYGGGGGGTYRDIAASAYGAAGGGGGSSGIGPMGTALVSNTTYNDGSNTGDGVVTINADNALTDAAFVLTKAPQYYKVPANISAISVRLYGGAGGGGSDGKGDIVYGLLPVSAGQVIQVNVGGVGGGWVSDPSDPTGNTPDIAASWLGGWNGGGNGGTTSARDAHAQGGGGGATDIRICQAIQGLDPANLPVSPPTCGLADRFIVAGGGGGNGWGAGGNGGGLANGNGAAGGGAYGGQGGTLTAGGAGGGYPSTIYIGQDGSLGQGGNALRQASNNGSGGGGGFYGGGGTFDFPGGGGSSCASVTGACSPSRNVLGTTNAMLKHTQGSNPTDGMAIITPTPESRTALNNATPNGASMPPTSISASSAYVYGAINPHYIAAQARVYWSTSATTLAAGSGTQVIVNATGTTDPIVTGNSWLNVDGMLTGLPAGSRIYYWVCAASPVGVSCGDIMSFDTLPAPSTPVLSDATVDSASITSTTVNLTGIVTNPKVGPTTVTFQCATNAAFTTGLVNTTANPSPVTGLTAVPVTGQCTGLTPGTAYYVRIRGVNPAGIGYSTNNATFTTTIAPVFAASPVVTSGAISSNFASFSATLSNPGNGTSPGSTTIAFECSTSSSFTTVIAGSATPSTATGTSSTPLTGNCASLTPNTTYYVRAKATNLVGTTYAPSSGGVSFTTLPVPHAPVVGNPTTSNITTSSVDLAGAVTDPGYGPTSVYFECSTSATFASNVSTFVANPASTTGTSSVAVTGSCLGLQQGTQYWARIRAVNSAALSGVTSTTPVSFTTTGAVVAPTVGLPDVQVSGGVPVLDYTSASLTVSVTNPGSGPTTIQFQCSTSPSFTTVITGTNMSPATALTGTSAVTVTADCTGLTSYTQYFVRVKATNSAAPAGVYSSINSFTTQAYVITPTVAAVSVVNGTVTGTSADFAVSVTNPGSGNDPAGVWTQTPLSVQCATDSGFTTGLVTGTITSPVSGNAEGRTPVAVTGGCTGLTGNTPYWVRVGATNTPSGGSLATVWSTSATFTTTPVITQAVVANPTVTAVTANSADFSVSVTDPGFGPTAIYFECSTSSAFTTIAVTSTGLQSPVSGSSATTVTGACAPINNATVYYVRVKAVNTAGTSYNPGTGSPAVPVMFTTAAVITTPQVSAAAMDSGVTPNPTYTGAAVTGTVTNPGGGPTIAYVECSTNPSFPQNLTSTFTALWEATAGNWVSTNPADAGGVALTGTSAVPVKGACSGGTEATTYYVRVKATNSQGSGRSSNAVTFTTAAYVNRPTIGAVTFLSSGVDMSGSVPYTLTTASFSAEVTNPGSGNASGSWSNTAVGFQCSTDPTFTAGVIAGTVTSPVSGNVTGRSPVTVAGECVGMPESTVYYVRLTGTSTPTNPAQNPGVQQTIDGASSTFTTTAIVAPPTYVATVLPTPPVGTPTTPVVGGIFTQTVTSVSSTVVTVTADTGTNVSITVNGVTRTAGTPAVPTDVCTENVAPNLGTFACVLPNPAPAVGDTLTVTSTTVPVSPNAALSSHVDVIVPATPWATTAPGTAVTAYPAQQVENTLLVPGAAKFKAKVNPGNGAGTVVFVYSTSPAFATASNPSTVSPLYECSTGPTTVSGSAATFVEQNCQGIADQITTYWVRAKSVNTPTNGQTSLVPAWSNPIMFTSLESTGTAGAPLGITVTTRTTTALGFSAVINPANAVTTVEYECSTDPTFATIDAAMVAPQSPVSGRAVVSTTGTCTGLLPGTAYNVRVKLTNANGTAYPSTIASTLSAGGGGGGAGGGGGGGGGGTGPTGPTTLGPFAPNPVPPPGQFTMFENGVEVGGVYTPTHDRAGATISTGSFQVTFRGLDDKQLPIPITASPQNAVVVGCNGYVNISGNGASNGSTGKLWIYAGETFVGDVPVMGGGTFSSTLPLPANIGGSDFAFQFNTWMPGGAVRSATVGVVIEACPQATSTTRRGTKLVKTTQQIFFTGKGPELDEASKKQLERLVDKTSTMPISVTSVGYVPASGSTPAQRTLAKERAETVLKYLLRGNRVVPTGKAQSAERRQDGSLADQLAVKVTIHWNKPVTIVTPAPEAKNPADAPSAVAHTKNKSVKTSAKAAAGKAAVKAEKKAEKKAAKHAHKAPKKAAKKKAATPAGASKKAAAKHASKAKGASKAKAKGAAKPSGKKAAHKADKRADKQTGKQATKKAARGARAK